MIAEKVYLLLDEGVHAANERHFFLTIAPVAPHGNIFMNDSILDEYPVFENDVPISSKRHQHLFEDLTVPWTENFNPNEVCENTLATVSVVDLPPYSHRAQIVLKLKQQIQGNLDTQSENSRRREHVNVEY